jgi:hypothetical protein
MNLTARLAGQRTPAVPRSHRQKKGTTMQEAHHHFSDLFAQLGLPTDPQGIAQFLAQHRPLAGDVRLPDAPFWSTAQATFLKEALLQDSDWAELADQLSEALRGDETPAA